MSEEAERPTRIIEPYEEPRITWPPPQPEPEREPSHPGAEEGDDDGDNA